MVGLVQAAQRGDRQALTELIEASRRWVRGVVYALVKDAARTDDVVQTVWLRVAQQIRNLRDPALWNRWLYQIARNAALDEGMAHRRRQRAQSQLLGDPGVAEAGGGPAARLARREVHERVLAAIRGLPRIYREPFVLKHLQGLSYQEIAEALDMPVATVETRLVRARRLLRETLKDFVDV